MSEWIRGVLFRLRTKRTYVSIFMYITIVCTLILMISTVVLYSFFSKTTITEYGNQSANLLQKDAESTGFLLDWTLSYALQSRNDPVILPYVQHNYENSYLNYEVWSRLKNIIESHPFIYSIYLINGYNGNILDTLTGVNDQAAFYDPGLLELLRSKQTLMSQMIVPRELNVSVKGVELHKRLLSIIIPYDLGSSPSVFVMNMDSDALSKVFGVSSGESLAQIDLITDQHIVVSSSNPAQFTKDLSGSVLMDGLTGPSRWFLSEEQGDQQLVVFADVQFTHTYHWYMVVKLPLNSLNQKISQLRNRTILSFSFILILALGVIWGLSRKIYSPIRKLTRDIEELSEQKEHSRNYLKENFMSKLITIGTHESQDQLSRYLAEYKIKLPASRLRLAVVRIDGLLDFTERYSIYDQSLLRLAISNIGLECLGDVRAEAIDPGQDHIVLLLEADENGELIERRLQESQVKIGEFLKLSVTIAASRETYEYRSLPMAYRTALELTNERFKLGPGLLIAGPVQDPLLAADYSYPERIEKQLLFYCKQQKEKETCQELREFMNRIVHFPYPECRLAVANLIINLGKTLNSLKPDASQADIPFDWGLSSIHDQIEHLESLDAIHQWLVEILSISFAEQRDVPASEHKDVIQEVFRIVDRHLFDPNLSSKSISDQVGLSVNYIRTMFKSTTNMSIIDYISDKRLDYAGRMLLSSTGSVEEIAAQTGFSAISSFYSAFKKKFGVTPAQFRKDAELERS